MSLEAAIEKLNTNIETLISVTEQANEGRAAALAAAQAVTDSAKAPRKPRETKAADTGGAATTAETTAPAGPPSVDDVRAAFGVYLGVEDAAVREPRKEKVRKLLAHFKTEKATEMAEEHRAQAIAWIKTLSEGGSVPELEPEGDSLI